MSTDFYETLKVLQTATVDEIRRSYQALALQYHPDKNRTAERVSSDFIAITEAWNTLRDPEKRRVYDAELFQLKNSDTPTVHDTLDSNDCELDSTGEWYTYTCRCGCRCEVARHTIVVERWPYNTCDECSHVVLLNVC